MLFACAACTNYGVGLFRFAKNEEHNVFWRESNESLTRPKRGKSPPPRLLNTTLKKKKRFFWGGGKFVEDQT